MIKSELIRDISQETNIPASTVTKVIDLAIDTIINQVVAGETVSIKNFGTFVSVNRAERNGRNPKTGTPLIIEARKVPRFKAGKFFKDAVNK